MYNHLISHIEAMETKYRNINQQIYDLEKEITSLQRVMSEFYRHTDTGRDNTNEINKIKRRITQISNMLSSTSPSIPARKETNV